MFFSKNKNSTNNHVKVTTYDTKFFDKKVQSNNNITTLEKKSNVNNNKIKPK